MTLFELLKLIKDDAFPLECQIDKRGRKHIYSIPNTVHQVCICFMSEEETWIRCNIENEILIPWYDCKVKALNPEDEVTLCVWLEDEEYILENYPQYLRVTKHDTK